MKKNNLFKCLAIALPFLLLSCSFVSAEAQFKSEVRELVNDSFDDPQFNKEWQEVFRKYLGWDGAIELGKEHCQWIEEGKSEKEVRQILTNRTEKLATEPGEQVNLLILSLSIRDPAVRAYCPGRDI